MDNLFFEKKNLKNCGLNVTIGKTARIRYPELVEIEDNVIIDDFIYISTVLKIGSYVHISSGTMIIGGPTSSVVFKDFSTTSPNVVLSAGSDDYVSGLPTPLVPLEYKGTPTSGKIIIGKFCIVGSNSVVLPNVELYEGSALGALSLANDNLEPWQLYGGVPARLIKARDKENTIDIEKKFSEMINKYKEIQKRDV